MNHLGILKRKISITIFRRSALHSFKNWWGKCQAGAKSLKNIFSISISSNIIVTSLISYCGWPKSKISRLTFSWKEGKKEGREGGTEGQRDRRKEGENFSRI